MPSKKRPSELQSADNDAYSHSKKSKISADHLPTAKVDSNGDRYWEISRMRRVTISSFRGKTLVNVREYYEKDGQELPGKKGISMSIDQFASLVKLLPDIEQALEQQGESLPRPAYAEDRSRHGPEPQNEHEEEKASKDANTSKQNIDATSDEDESED